jgi:beta-phosphoglucomutase
MPCLAILFDFDGVLGETMEDNFRAWQTAFARRGAALTRGEYFPLEGMNVLAVARTLLDSKRMDPALAPALAADKDRAYLDSHAFSLCPGAAELLDALRGRARLALVSGGGRERLARTVPPGFLERFDAVVTGDDVTRPKPDPEPYARALSLLGLPAGRCLAVENAPLGIAAAKAAGLRCLAVQTTLGAEHLGEADAVCRDLAALRPLLEGALAGEGRA